MHLAAGLVQPLCIRVSICRSRRRCGCHLRLLNLIAHAHCFVIVCHRLFVLPVLATLWRVVPAAAFSLPASSWRPSDGRGTLLTLALVFARLRRGAVRVGVLAVAAAPAAPAPAPGRVCILLAV